MTPERTVAIVRVWPIRVICDRRNSTLSGSWGRRKADVQSGLAVRANRRTHSKRSAAACASGLAPSYAGCDGM